MNERIFDILAYVFRIVLPALSALYVALAGIWGLPFAEQIAGTIAAIVAFANAILKASTVNYMKAHTVGEDFE